MFIDVAVTSIDCPVKGTRVISTDPRKSYVDARKLFGFPKLSGVSPSQINYPNLDLDVNSPASMEKRSHANFLPQLKVFFNIF